MRHNRDLLLSLLGLSVFVALNLPVQRAKGQMAPAITVSSSVPNELNPPFNSGPPASGGAPAATPEQAAAFAWQEFIALNWPAGPQQGQLGQRDTPSLPSSYKFGDPTYTGPLVWETFRGKAEIFPGDGNPPPGYAGSTAAPWGYDALPAYNYILPISACDSKQASDPVPWINLDETDQISLDNMYAGVVEPNSSPGNSAPQLIRFLAKANRTHYTYVAGNQWWSNVPDTVVTNTKIYLSGDPKTVPPTPGHQASPPPGSTDKVSLPNGTIEIKAAWRPLNPLEIASGRFHTQTVRFYEPNPGPDNPCYRDATGDLETGTWGLVALHIIQKTPSAPYFIYATFEQADNILANSLAADGRLVGSPVEDADGNIILQPEPATATSPQVCLVDPKPNPPGTLSDPSTSGQVILTDDPTTCTPSKAAQYCGSPGNQLYYRNAQFSPPNNQPAAGNICVNKRDNALPDYVISANKKAHTAISDYLKQNNIQSAPWLFYKLINIQYFPYDKIPDPNIPNGSPYTTNPPYTASNPAPSSYYQANIVVETNRSLQLFAGGLSPQISTQWNQDATLHKNTYYGGRFYNMGGCMGCHGSQGQNPAGQAGDFSVILARGAVVLPEVPAQQTSKGLTQVYRNRSLKK